MSNTNNKIYLDFMEVLWVINEKGDPKKAFKEFLFHLKCNNINGKPNTLKSLAASYREYVDYTSAHIHKDPKYRKKDDKLLELFEYLTSRTYNESFKLPISARDEYLYGIKREESHV